MFFDDGLQTFIASKFVKEVVDIKADPQLKRKMKAQEEKYHFMQALTHTANKLEADETKIMTEE